MANKQQVDLSANAQNPFDISAEESELNALNAELEQAQASLEADFAKVEAEKFSNDTAFQELVFEQPEAFFQQVLQDQNAFLAEKITPKVERANQLNADISQKKQFGAIDAALKTFQAAHPDVNVDELMNFFVNQLPPEIQNQLQSLPPEQFFEELLALFEKVQNGAGGANAQNSGVVPTQEDLPQQIQGVPTEATQVQGGSRESYLSRD